MVVKQKIKRGQWEHERKKVETWEGEKKGKIDKKEERFCWNSTFLLD